MAGDGIQIWVVLQAPAQRAVASFRILSGVVFEGVGLLPISAPRGRQFLGPGSFNASVQGGPVNLRTPLVLSLDVHSKAKGRRRLSTYVAPFWV